MSFSFSFKVKKEIASIPMDDITAMKAELYGFLLFSKEFSKESILFVSENKFVIDRYCRMMRLLFDQSMSLDIKCTGRSLFCVSVPNSQDRADILDFFAEIREQCLSSPLCIRSFLRGGFMCCGNVTDPCSEYHLEFLIARHETLENFYNLFSFIPELNFTPKTLLRKSTFIVYIKNSEWIIDVLTYIGASHMAMEFMQIKMLKELRNRVNRTTNFEAANIKKTASAVALQLRAIEKIREQLGIAQLPKDLQELANLRIEYPDLSLSRLALLFHPPLSRSGVYHRMKRLIQLAEHLPS